MRKMKSFFRSPMGTTLMFMVAVLLLMTGTIGGVRATPQIFNPDFAYGGVELDQIGITLVENGTDISWRNYDKESESFIVGSNNPNPDPNKPGEGALLLNMIPTGEKLKLGYKYPEVLTVKNSGSIPEYVRVTVYKYWVDKSGKRFDAYDKDGKDLINGLIKLHFREDNGWVIDHNSDTKERTVLYYKNVVGTVPNQNETPPFADYLIIDDTIMDYAEVKTETNGNTVSWVADGKTFMIEAWADGVQDHNARAAMKSAWGLTDAQIDSFGIVFG